MAKKKTKTDNKTFDASDEAQKEGSTTGGDDEEDFASTGQCHGDHWGCVIKQDNTKEFSDYIARSIEDSTLYAHFKCDYVLDERQHGDVVILEYLKDTDSLAIRAILANNGENNELVSAYPLVADGVQAKVRIDKIEPWDNLLEGWISGEILVGKDEEDEDAWQLISFFDADFSKNKNKYKEGGIYTFVLGALCYWVDRNEEKSFELKGQKAIDFYKKSNEKVEYEKDGSVKPIHFSLENLCSFMQTGQTPDDVQFITTVEKVETIHAFEKDFWAFNIKLTHFDDGDVLSIPAFAKKTDKNKDLDKEPQLKGTAWVVGFLLDNENIKQK